MNIKIKEKQSIGLKGVYTFTKAKLKTSEQYALHEKIKRYLKEGREAIDLIRKLNSICETKVFVEENIIPDVGRGMIANNLVATSPTDVMRINYTALGDSATAVANGDVALGNEVYRKTTASYTNAANVAYVTAFYTADEDDDTYHEAGLFSNATGAADSGVLFSHVLLNQPTGIIKSNTETLTLDYILTVN